MRMNELMDLNEAYERIEWQIKHDVDNYDKDPTIAGLIDLERIKEAIDELQAYKDKEDRLREFLENEPNDLYSTTPTKKYWVIDILQILNEGDK